MHKYIKEIAILFVAVMLLMACSGRLSFNPEDGLEGHWHAEFSATYLGVIMPEAGGELVINHNSDMYFADGRFEITLDPPAYQMPGGVYLYNAIWKGNYSVSYDTLFMTNDLNPDLTERYHFRISGDTLTLSYIPIIVQEQDGKVLAEIPMYGGLPWGRAFMWHAGEFHRASIQDPD